MNRVIPDPQSWLRIINEMILSGEYRFAEEFLRGVRDQIRRNEAITTKQTAAILNIRRSVNELEG